MHEPQWAGDDRSPSQPSFGLPLQSAQPIAHAPITQAPALHEAAACAKLQPCPQEPQWAVAVIRSVSQPLTLLPSQSPQPTLHENPQAPAAQVAVALAKTQA